MTKKDYVKFAAMFREQFVWLNGIAIGTAGAAAKGTVLALLEETANIFERDNPNFDRERFYAVSKPSS